MYSAWASSYDLKDTPTLTFRPLFLQRTDGGAAFPDHLPRVHCQPVRLHHQHPGHRLHWCRQVGPSSGWDRHTNQIRPLGSPGLYLPLAWRGTGSPLIITHTSALLQQRSHLKHALSFSFPQLWMAHGLSSQSQPLWEQPLKYFSIGILS